MSTTAEQKPFGHYDNAQNYIKPPEDWYDASNRIEISDFRSVGTYSEGNMFDFTLLGAERSMEILKKETLGSIITFYGVSGTGKIIKVEFDESDKQSATIYYNAEDAAS